MLLCPIVGVLEKRWQFVAKDAKVYDKFITKLVEGKTSVVIFLINGVKLQGIIDDFDDVSVVLRKDPYVQLLYRHAISTIVPQYKTEEQN